MIRLKQFRLQDILPHIGKAHKCFHADGHLWRIPMTGARLRLFQRTQECAACLLQGTHFWLEYSGCFAPHFNLYGLNYKGQPVMLTMDHIVPKSKGGTKTDSNLQLLCEKCNTSKGNKSISIEELRERRCQGDPSLRQFVMERLASRTPVHSVV